MSQAIQRGASPVAGPSRWFKTKRGRRVMMAAGGLFALAFFALAINSIINSSPYSRPEDTGSNFIGQTVAAPPPPPPTKAQLAGQAPAIVQQGMQDAPKDYVRFPTSSTSSYFAPEKATEGATKAADREDGTKALGQTEVAFKPTELIGGKAGKAIRYTYMMMPSMIPCILDTAMDSTLAGAIRCHTTEDILSPEHVLLLPAGTQIMGTYKNETGNEENRLFALAGAAYTKDGIPVPLNSEIADGVGRAGIDGQVDHHYIERFAGAGLLVTADAALSLGQTELSKAGQTNLNINGGGSGFSGLAQTLLNKTINQPNTIYVQPGKQITIVTDHLIDFSDALRVRTRE